MEDAVFSWKITLLSNDDDQWWGFPQWNSSPLVMPYTWDAAWNRNGSVIKCSWSSFLLTTKGCTGGKAMTLVWWNMWHVDIVANLHVCHIIDPQTCNFKKRLPVNVVKVGRLCCKVPFFSQEKKSSGCRTRCSKWSCGSFKAKVLFLCIWFRMRHIWSLP